MTERYLGLCMAAGGIKTGTDTVLGEIRSHRAKFVLVASDASERTKKQLTDKCNYYKVTVFSAGYTGAQLAQLLGKKSQCAAVAFIGKGPWEKVKETFLPAQTEESTTTEDRKDEN